MRNKQICGRQDCQSAKNGLFAFLSLPTQSFESNQSDTLAHFFLAFVVIRASSIAVAHIASPALASVASPRVNAVLV